MKPLHRTAPARRAGFTLAEVAVTLVIVGIALTFVVQGLQGSQLQAAHTRNFKLARDLALEILGQVESGQLRDELDGDSYSSTLPDHPDFAYEILLGEDEEFDDAADADDQPFDSFAARRQRAEEQDGDSDDDEEDEEEVEEPFQRVQVRVTFPRFGELSTYVTLEALVPWEQVYGPSEEDEEQAAAEGSAP
ncbi:MAG TPA: type II secretion system protein [Planctomycetota bacterium]|nr:type II secretion system protein [Planctomycetota bacterium]